MANEVAHVTSVYYEFCSQYSRPVSINREISSAHLCAFLRKSMDKKKITIYAELLEKVLEFNSINIPNLFIERFCLNKLSDLVLEKHPVNIAEAFILSYIMLNSPVNIDELYLELGLSGLLVPTMINGTMEADATNIAVFVMSSLSDAKMIDFMGVDKKDVIIGNSFKAISYHDLYETDLADKNYGPQD